MFYTKVQVSVCDTVTFKRAPLAARGVWLQLSILCAKEENRGTVQGARQFDETTWIMACGFKRKDIEVAVAAGILAWEGDALVILGYDQTGEDKHAFNRQVGNLGGRPKKNPTPIPGHIPSDNRPDNRPVSENETPSNPVQSSPNQSKPSSPSAPVPDDGDDGKVLKFIRSLGGYMSFQAENKGPDWLRDVHGLTLEQIREIFDWARQRGKTIVLPGQGPGYFGGFRTAMQEASRKAAAAERVRMEADALAERERLELSGLNERASKAEAATRARCGGFLAAYDEDPARWLAAMTGEQCDQIKAIRTTYNAGRPLGLLVRHLEGMPRDLVEAGTARGREMHEQTEGATA